MTEPLQDTHPRVDATGKAATRLRAFAREHLHGGCRILSLGSECVCPLCDIDLIEDALSRSLARVRELEKDARRLDELERLRDEAGLEIKWRLKASTPEVRWEPLQISLRTSGDWTPPFSSFREAADASLRLTESAAEKKE